ncbi:MAG: hypothetical protein AAFY76_03515 [Cyanobacteria bacterium J06649_11]
MVDGDGNGKSLLSIPPNLTISSDASKTGWGAACQGMSTGGSMDLAGSQESYKYTRTEGSTVSHSNLCSYMGTSSNTSTIRQHHSSGLFNENGRDKEFGSDKFKSGNLELFIEQTDHDYFRIPPRYPECDSGQGVSSDERFQRVEIEQENFSQDCLMFRVAGDRSVRVKSVASASSLHFLETGPIQSQYGCLSKQMEIQTKLCIPTVLSDREGFRESSERSKLFNTNHPRVASATLVSQTTTDECGMSNLTPKVLKTPYKSFGESSSPDRKQYLKISGLAGFRENLETKGISKAASDLISSSRRPGTISHYESSWRKWVCWCNRKKVSPTKCDIKFILDFLASLFEEGLQYSAICSYRSAVSAYHEVCDGVAVGKHPLVSSLITGIFNCRPPKPKYTFI